MPDLATVSYGNLEIRSVSCRKQGRKNVSTESTEKQTYCKLLYYVVKKSELINCLLSAYHDTAKLFLYFGGTEVYCTFQRTLLGATESPDAEIIVTRSYVSAPKLTGAIKSNGVPMYKDYGRHALDRLFFFRPP